MFDIDFRNLAVKLWVPFLRKTRMMELMYALLRPLKSLNEQLILFREATKYQLVFSASIIYLEHYLNDIYDPLQRRIFIEDVSNIEYFYLFNYAEVKHPVYTDNYWVTNQPYQKGEVVVYGVPGLGTFRFTALTTTLAVPTNATQWLRWNEVDYILNQSEYFAQTNYIIYLPLSIPYNENVLREQVDVYNTASRKYIIQQF